MSAALLGILAYVLLQFAIVVVVVRRRRRNNEADYLLAGRRFGPMLATFTIFATWFGAETCIGAAGAVYEGGLSNSVADPFGYTVCLLLMGFFFAMPLWRRQLTTLADLYRQRYTPGVERLVAVLLIPTSVMWAAAQVRALGQVVSASSVFDVDLAIGLAAGVVVAYTVYGGLMADAITDVVQGLMVMAGLIVLLVVIVDAVGGINAAASSIDVQRLQLFGGHDTPTLEILERWAVPIAGSALAQELVAVILASHTAAVAQRASLMASVLYFGFGLIPVVVGLIGVTLMPGLKEAEQLLPQIAQKYLGTLPYIIFVGAIVSAILSTVASALLAAAAIAQHNLIVPLAPTLTPKARVRVARGCVIVAGIVAYVLARHTESVYGLVEQASAFASAGVFTVGVIGLYSRFGNATAAYSALIAGSAAWVIGHYLIDLPYAYLTSLAAALVAYVIGAFMERAPQSAVEPS